MWLQDKIMQLVLVWMLLKRCHGYKIETRQELEDLEVVAVLAFLIEDLGVVVVVGFLEEEVVEAVFLIGGMIGSRKVMVEEVMETTAANGEQSGSARLWWFLLSCLTT